jgi:anthranilate/para-aminobenzoate synthase component II
LTNELGIPISFKHLQRITKDLGVRCKRPKLELLHDKDYEEEKEKVENYKQISSALKKGSYSSMMVVKTSSLRTFQCHGLMKN